MDILFQKRWLALAGVLVLVNILLMSLLVSAAQARRSDTSRTHNTSSISLAAAHTYDSPNVITNGMAMLSDDIGQNIDTANQTISNSVASVVIGTAHGGKLIGRGTIASVSFAARGVGSVFLFVGHVSGSGVSIVGHALGASLSFVGHGVGSGFGAVGHAATGTFSFAAKATHLSSLIRPADHTPTPIITQLRAQQAAIIQTGTEGVLVTPRANGSGGACDAGNGNGGYPMKWCNTPMDSVATVSYSSDPINRECTSYAYWYFTSVEGHAGFWVTGNAKYWAATSNYPTHASPAVGAIAVETAGAYGHVAIVQALPGQEYAGRVVPAGYVLVSEMNYDWNGHFRYSYSPLSKFSAYIYP